MIPANKIISIHAPAKGATPKVHSILLVWRISIHAPAKGATVMDKAHGDKWPFQSTLPRRERL